MKKLKKLQEQSSIFLRGLRCSDFTAFLRNLIADPNDIIRLKKLFMLAEKSFEVRKTLRNIYKKMPIENKRLKPSFQAVGNKGTTFEIKLLTYPYSRIINRASHPGSHAFPYAFGFAFSPRNEFVLQNGKIIPCWVEESSNPQVNLKNGFPTETLKITLFNSSDFETSLILEVCKIVKIPENTSKEEMKSKEMIDDDKESIRINIQTITDFDILQPITFEFGGEIFTMTLEQN